MLLVNSVNLVVRNIPTVNGRHVLELFSYRVTGIKLIIAERGKLVVFTKTASSSELKNPHY